MLFDNGSLRERANDQAEGLRQLRRSDTAPAVLGRVMPWPRLVLISEFPGSDLGARFAFHLAHALSRSGSDQSAQRSLLVDLAPAASRLPHVLTDWIPSNRYPPMWSEVAAGRSLSAFDLGERLPLAVAAESQMMPAAIDQLPRLYEQFVRQLSRHSRWQWVVLLALDHIVPLDRPCWQAADDILLLGGSELSGTQRQAAAMRSRLADVDPNRRLWTLPGRSASWRSRWMVRNNEAVTTRRWLEAGVATQLLPAVRWPHVRGGDSGGGGRLRAGARADRRLAHSAAEVAGALRLAAGCEDAGDLAKLSGVGKKIQLTAQRRPITLLSEVFRA